MTKAELTAPPHMPRMIPGSGPHQAIRLMPRLMQPMAEVLPLVQQLVHVERVARAAAVRDRGPDEGRRADRFLAYVPQWVTTVMGSFTTA